jgi:hypothetical protein
MVHDGERARGSMRWTTRQAMAAGLAYFGVVFALGFVLGVLRTLFVLPLAGETAAVAIELPIILGLAWIACRRLVRRFRLPPMLAARLVMGVVAFGLLMIGELSLSVLLGGRGLAEHLALYQQIPHLLGLAGQVTFALFPIIQSCLTGNRDQARTSCHSG